MPIPSKLGLAACLAVLGLAVAVSRHSGYDPSADHRPIVVAGPPAVLVAAGSIEARLAWLEARVLELQARLDDQARP